MARTAEKIGRVRVSDEGIEQGRMLGLFGKAFRVRWIELHRWWVVDRILLNKNTGSEKILGHVLGLEFSNTADTIHGSGGSAEFKRLVDAIRVYAAHKEIPGDSSPLALLTRHVS